MGRIEALAQRYRSGDTTPEDVARAQLALAAGNDAHSIFTQLTPELALAQARASTERWARGTPLGPLDGVPLTVKDLFDLEGTATTRGSRVTGRAPAQRDAACVARLRAAGAVVLGKTSLSEFAFSGLGLNPHFGTPVQRAPRTGATHLVGGSSSGAAAALRAGIGCVALGSDTSGSVRVPAAWSGLVGWRPSQARYPLDGVALLAPSLDTVGVLASSVADVLAMDAVLHGEQPQLADTAPTFVFAANLCGGKVQHEVRDNCARFMARVADAGFACEEARVVALEQVMDAFAAHGTLVAAEAAHELRAFTEPAVARHVDPFVQRRLAAAREMRAHDLIALQQLRHRLLQEAASVPQDVIYVFPTTPATAPALAALHTPERIAAANASALSHTMPCSFLDMPGIALPSGHDGAGLPTSVLLCCPRGRDALLLSAARRLEALALFNP
ncbi:MAG: amidase family protein [Pseudomonadota bacterium]